MLIKGAIAVSMRHVVWRGKIVECDPIAGDMLHGDGHPSQNMHATDLFSNKQIVKPLTSKSSAVSYRSEDQSSRSHTSKYWANVY